MTSRGTCCSPLRFRSDADNTSSAEYAAALSKDGKKNASAELSKANSEWTARASRTVAETEKFRALDSDASGLCVSFSLFFFSPLPPLPSNNQAS